MRTESSVGCPGAPRARRVWWVLLAVGAVFVLVPLVLWPFVTLPPAVMLLPVWTIGVGLWLFMRTLDMPGAGESRGTAARPPAPPAPASNVISLDEVRRHLARTPADRRVPGRHG